MPNLATFSSISHDNMKTMNRERTFQQLDAIHFTSATVPNYFITPAHMLACPFASLAAKQLDLFSEHRRFPLPEQFVPVSHRETLMEFVEKCVRMCGLAQAFECLCMWRWMYTEVSLCFSVCE